MRVEPVKAPATPRPDGHTHSTLSEFHLPELPSAGTFALITIKTDNERKPATFSPASLLELGSLLELVTAKASTGELVGLGITGHERCFVAGADLTALRGITDEESARRLARLGHETFDALAALNVPTFAFINGAAIGGGLEIALAADYRAVSTSAKLSLPEAYLGLVPGWGGLYRLPRLIGPGKAVEVMIENALSNNRVMDGRGAFEAGITDAIFPAENFLEHSLAWAATVITGSPRVIRPLTARRKELSTYTDEDWDAAIVGGRTVVESKTSGAAPAPLRLLDLLKQGKRQTKTQSADLEVAALAELIRTPQFKDSAYAFLDLLQHRSKNPTGAGDLALARNITKIGVVGAGLMAGQLALIFARRLKVPVVLTDIDQPRLDRGLTYVSKQIDGMLAKNRISPETAEHTRALITGSISKEPLTDADFVIEAVFEELAVKQQVLAEVEAVVEPTCILATNTSSLSVAEMAATLSRPERVVGFHFFNPVAAMPLLEIVQAPKTSAEVLATAFALGKALGKSAVLVKDSTAFVVNRVLLRLLGEVTAAFDEGTPAEVADSALKPMGLPMTPFTLLAMIGLPVSLHITQSLHTAFGDRFPVSTNLQTLVANSITALWALDADGNRSIPASTLNLLKFGDSPSTSQEVLVRVQDALAEEVGLLLAEGVVASAQDIDLCMITGAGWPLHLGGITRYLDRTGASERTMGRLFQ